MCALQSGCGIWARHLQPSGSVPKSEATVKIERVWLVLSLG